MFLMRVTTSSCTTGTMLPVIRGKLGLTSADGFEFSFGGPGSSLARSDAVVSHASDLSGSSFSFLMRVFSSHSLLLNRICTLDLRLDASIDDDLFVMRTLVELV